MIDLEEKICYTFTNKQYRDQVLSIAELRKAEVYKKRKFRILAIYGDIILRFAAWEHLECNNDAATLFKEDKKTFKKEINDKISEKIANDNLEQIAAKMKLALTSDGVEAVIGAIWKDSDFENAKKFANMMLEI